MPLKLVSRPGTTNLWIIGTVRGQRVRESSGTADPILAEEARSTREQGLYRAAVHGAPAAKVTFDQAILSYLTVEARGDGTKARLARLRSALLAGATCDGITQAMLDKACLTLLRSGAAPATRLREVITPARAVLQHAARRGWCPVPAFETICASPARTEWLTPPEAERLVTAAAPHLRPLLTFLLATGARLSEALDLEWPDVDLRYGRATLRETKNGRDRIVDLCPRALAALSGLSRREGHVFRTRIGHPYLTRNRLAGGQIKTGWAYALKRAKITREVTPHGCRHTWATWHYCMHRDLLLLRQDGGWRDTSQCERYAKLAPAGMAAEIEAWRSPKPELTQTAPEGADKVA